MVVTDSLMVKTLKALQPPKAHRPIELTELGIVSSVIPMQLPKGPRRRPPRGGPGSGAVGRCSGRKALGPQL